MFQAAAWISLGVAFASALAIAGDEFRHPQKMGVMNLVWPVTALYFSVLAVYAYFRIGRHMSSATTQSMPNDQMEQRQQRVGQARRNPRWQQTALSDSHRGAGCSLADIAVEFAVFGLGLTIAGSDLLAKNTWSLVTAWCLGIAFQYLTIQPMRNLSPLSGLWAAIRADTFSIAASQVGMYAWMALTYFQFFPHPHLQPNQAAYWLMMQVAMICGFLTAFPVNRLLVKWGWKEAMG